VLEDSRDTVGVGVDAEALGVAVEVGVGPADAPGWAVRLFEWGRAVVVVSGPSADPRRFPSLDGGYS
jgi:hypothetical protein